MRSISEQITLFALMVTLGIILGIVFDFYRVLRGVAEPGKITTVIGDILFWLCATALVFAVLMWKTWGEMRAYVLLGLFLGFLLHWYYFSPLTVKFFKWLVWTVIWLAKIIWRIVSWPFMLIKKLVTPAMIYTLAFSKAGIRRINERKKKCSNFVKKIFLYIFKKPPEND